MIRPFTCQRCGVVGETTRYRKYCKDCAETILREHNRDNQRARRKAGFSHACEYCGKEFRSKYAHQRFCSYSCSSSWRTKKGPTPAELARRRALRDECARAHEAANVQVTVIHRNGRVIEIRGQVPGGRFARQTI